MGSVEWFPIEDMPVELKDGRDLLFWKDGHPAVASWDRFLADNGNWEYDWATLEGDHFGGATYFAEINKPQRMKISRRFRGRQPRSRREIVENGRKQPFRQRQGKGRYPIRSPRP